MNTTTLPLPTTTKEGLLEGLLSMRDDGRYDVRDSRLANALYRML